jgi:hypothetical protein
VSNHNLGSQVAKQLQSGSLFLTIPTMSNNNTSTMNSHLVLVLPGKGAYAPNKFGCRYGDFIKTPIPGSSSPIWIYEGRTYDASNAADVAQFNKMCAEVIPHCYDLRMKVIPMILQIATPQVSQQKEEAQDQKVPELTDEQPSAAPKLPPLSKPPSRGKKQS